MSEHKWDGFDPNEGMLDIARCSCGWRSNPYYDGAPWARAEFERHIQSIDALRVIGVSRDAENDKVLILSLSRPAEDDELRRIHDHLRMLPKEKP